MTIPILGHSADISNSDSDICSHSRRECSQRPGRPAPIPDGDSRSYSHSHSECAGESDRLIFGPPTGGPGSLGNTSRLFLTRPRKSGSLFPLSGACFACFGGGRIQMENKKTARYRAGMCRRTIITPDNVAKIYKAPNGGAFFGSVMVCNSVWTCPVCESLIMATRRHELQELIAVHTQYGRRLIMVTLTAPHGADTKLGHFWSKFNQAVELFFRQRTVTGLLAGAGYIGRVGSVENTWGESNGWHNHRHELVFLKDDLDPAALKLALAGVWSRACRSCGLKAPNFEHGLDIRRGDAVAGEYLTKINSGLASEMTLASNKTPKEGRLTPWDIVRTWSNNPDAFAQGRDLWRDFVSASYRKKRIIGLSRLQKFYGLELSRRDELCAVEDSTDASLIALLGQDFWKIICRLELRADVLAIAEKVWESSGSVDETTQAIIDFVCFEPCRETQM